MELKSVYKLLTGAVCGAIFLFLFILTNYRNCTDIICKSKYYASLNPILSMTFDIYYHGETYENSSVLCVIHFKQVLNSFTYTS